MQIFKRLFEDGLDIQKQRIRELREYAKEKREALAQKQQNEIESLENLYPLSCNCQLCRLTHFHVHE